MGLLWEDLRGRRVMRVAVGYILTAVVLVVLGAIAAATGFSINGSEPVLRLAI